MLFLLMIENKHIVIFDGYCSLCNGFVSFLLRIDKKEKLIFVANHSKLAQDILKGQFNQSQTVVFSSNHQLYQQSDAVFNILRLMSFPWKLLICFQLLPKGFRDRIYNWIAQNRYRLLRRRETCRPVPLKWRDRIVLK